MLKISAIFFFLLLRFSASNKICFSSSVNGEAIAKALIVSSKLCFSSSFQFIIKPLFSNKTLRSYYHNNILAFGDLLHKVHPLAGQGFNMTIRDIKLLSEIIKKKLDVGLSLDSSVSLDFQKKLKHKNFIFSNGVDLIHEFFNLERKMKTSFMSKSVKFISSYPSVNKMFTKIADKGV